MIDGIAYFANVQTPGKRYFACPAGLGTLSVEACAQRHRAKKGETCTDCAVGQAHAGCEAPRLDFGNRCCHCLQLAGRSTFGLCDHCYVQNRKRLSLFCGQHGVNVKSARLVDALVRLVQISGRRRHFHDSDQLTERPARFKKPRPVKPKTKSKPIPKPITLDALSLDLWEPHAGTAL